LSQDKKIIFLNLTRIVVNKHKMTHSDGILFELKKNFFCAIELYLLVYHVSFQESKLCLQVANDKLDSKYFGVLER
jgi:hypothetical protein